MVDEQLGELLLEALETERGEIHIYETAVLRCVDDQRLQEEWAREADLSARRVELVEGVVDACGLDPGAKTTGRAAVHYLDATLVHAMEMALESAPPGTAALVATECVTLAESKDRLHWEALDAVSSRFEGEAASVLQQALMEVMLNEAVHPPRIPLTA